MGPAIAGVLQDLTEAEITASGLLDLLGCHWKCGNL